MDLTPQNVAQAIYRPEKLLFSTTINAIAPLSVDTRVMIPSFGQGDTPKFAVELGDLRIDQDQDLQVNLIADDDRNVLNAGAAPSNLGATVQRVRSVKNLALSVQNLNASITKNNVRLAYAVWIRNLTTAEKLLYGLKLSQRDQQLAQKFQLVRSVQQGFPYPIPLDKRIEQLYQGERVSYWNTITLSATEVEFISVNVPNGYVYVLESLAVSSGDVSQTIKVNVNRDGTPGYVSLDAYPLSLADEYSLFVHALHSLVISAVGSGSPTVSIRATIRRVRLTETLRLAFGLMPPHENQDLADRIDAGVV